MLRLSVLYTTLVEELKKMGKERTSGYAPDPIAHPWTVIPMIHKRDTLDIQAIYAMKICQLHFGGAHADVCRLILSNVIRYPGPDIIYDAILEEWKENNSFMNEHDRMILSGLKVDPLDDDSWIIDL